MSKEKTSTAQKRQQGPMGGGNAATAPVEKAKDFKGTFKKLLKYLGSYRYGILFCLLVAVGSTILTIAGPKISARATNLLVEGVLNKISGVGGIDFTAIANVLLIVAALYVAGAILQYIQGFILNGIAAKIGYTMRRDISEKINRMPLAYFDRSSQGDVLSRITNDVDTLSQSLGQSLSQLVTSATAIIGIIIMMFTINIWMTLATLVILPLSALLLSAIMKKSQPQFEKQQKYLGEANGQIEEMYGGHLVVKAFNHEEESIMEFDKINQRLHKSAWKSQFFGNLMMPVMNFVSNLGYVVVCILGGFLALGGSIGIGDIQAFIQYVRNFTQQIGQVANVGTVMQQSIASAERVLEFLEEEEEVLEIETPVDPKSIDGSVYFAHVNFGYLPEKTIINDFSAIIEQGKSVAIVGPTGAGKTTMVKLLMRFYDVNDGAILIDGYDLKQFSRNGLRGMFGMVLQDTWLYNDTIMENIRYGKLDATDEEVIAAAKSAQAHHFIRTLPDGYNTVLNEEATNISQGQKQLLTIARTILSDPKVLILDEATSSVDTRTEVHIQKAMAKLMVGRTSFVIAHRLSTIRDSDMILVMKDGDIVETGTHDELLEASGFYANLYNSQFETGLTA